MISINLRAEKSGTHSHTARLHEAVGQTFLAAFVTIFCTASVEGNRGTHSGDAVRYTLPLHCLCMAALKSIQMEWNPNSSYSHILQ